MEGRIWVDTERLEREAGQSRQSTQASIPGPVLLLEMAGIRVAGNTGQ